MGTVDGVSAEFASHKRVGPFCILLGLLLILASFYQPWGRAYGHTVVTPTPGILIGDPHISKTAAPDCCNPGDPVTFIIVVTNIGNADVTNVRITDTLPAELVLQTVTTTKGLVTVQGNHFEVHIDRISPGEIVTIVVHAVVGTGVPTDIVLVNTAYLYSDQGNRQDSAEVLIKPPGGCPTPPILPPTGEFGTETFLAGLREQADILLFDSPPLLTVADASILAAHADGILLVVDAGKTRREALRPPRPSGGWGHPSLAWS